MITKHILAIISLSVVVFTAAGQVAAAEKPELLAQTAAEQWLALVDGGQFAESWKSAATSFQTAVSEAQWNSSLNAVRKPLGSLASRKLKSAKYTKSVPGAPDGEYVILQFEHVLHEQEKRSRDRHTNDRQGRPLEGLWILH